MKQLVLTAAIVAATQLHAQPSPERVLESLDRYLADYQPRLSELIADEQMIQQIGSEALRAARRSGSPMATARLRRLNSEVAFVALPGEAGWLGFRHVTHADGSRIKDAGVSLTQSLRSASFDSARSLLEASASHNLGLPRTTNLPNLPLEFLHARNRARLSAELAGVERVRGVDTTRVVFVERTSPTLIRNPNGTDMPSLVRAWIDGRGRLVRAEVLTYHGTSSKRVESEIRVEFAENPKVGLMVPSEMREWFPIADEFRGSSVARYTNFRRFTTSARIVPQ